MTGPSAARRAVLKRYRILDTPPEAPFDDLCQLAARVCRVPIAVLGFVDERRHWFKARIGVEVSELPLDRSLDPAALLQDETLLIRDLRSDERTAGSAWVSASFGVRSYAGAPLLTPEGVAIGALSVMDRTDRDFGAEVAERLGCLARQAMALLEARRLSEERFRAIVDTVADGIITIDEESTIRSFNRAAELLFGYSADEVLGRNVSLLVAPPDRERHDGYIARYMATGEKRIIGRGRYGRGLRKDGRTFPLHLAVDEADVAGGRLFVGVVRDLTEAERLQADLGQSEGRFRMVHEYASDAIVRIDRAGTVVEANPRACDLTGYGREELVGLGISQLLVWENLEARPLRLAAIERGKGLPFERPFRRKDGSIRTVEGTASELPDGTLQAILRDVTERKRAEVELRESEERFRQLADSIGEVFWIASPGHERIHYLSPAFEQVWGRPREELYANPAAWTDTIHPEDRELVLAEARASPDQHEHAHRIVRPDGTVRWVRVRVFPVRDGAGAVYRVAGIAEDITEARHAEEERRRSEERYRMLTEQAADGISVVDDGGRFLEANPRLCQMLGYTRQEMLELSVADVLSREDVASFPERVEVLRTGRSLLYERRLRRKDGTWLDVEVSTRRVEEDRIQAITRDITERKRAEEALRASQDRLLRVLGNAEIVLWTVDLEGVFTLMEGKALAALEDRPGSAVGSSMYEAYADFPEGLRNVERSLRGETFSAVVGGRGRLFEVFYFPDHNATGEIVGASGVAIDVTERTRAQEALALLSSAVDQTADNVFITDKEGCILYVNAAFESHTGYAREEAIGRTPRLLKSGDHEPGFYEGLWTTILDGHVFRGEFVNRKKSGETYHEEKTIAPVRDAEGRITHFVSAGRDVTERRRTWAEQSRLQEAVQKSAQEWRATFDAVDTPVLILDREGRVKRVNRAARDLWGRSYDEVLGRSLPDETREPWQAMRRAAGSVRGGRSSHSLQARDEPSGKTWDVSANALTGPDVEAGGIILLARDVTPVVALQESLRRSEKMSVMGRLVAGAEPTVRDLGDPGRLRRRLPRPPRLPRVLDPAPGRSRAPHRPDAGPARVRAAGAGGPGPGLASRGDRACPQGLCRDRPRGGSRAGDRGPDRTSRDRDGSGPPAPGLSEPHRECAPALASG
jgi:PAS domain S-box-containing protein